jgi:hypothetical protein
MKYFTKQTLRSAAKEAIKYNFNRQVDIGKLAFFLKANTLYPVTFELLHNDSEMRCQVALSEKENVWLDVTLERWDALPIVPEELLS